MKRRTRKLKLSFTSSIRTSQARTILQTDYPHWLSRLRTTRNSGGTTPPWIYATEIYNSRRKMVSVGSNLVTKIDMQYYTSPSGVKCKNQEQKKRNRNCHPIWQYQSPRLTVPYRRLVLSYHPFGTVKFRHRQKKQPEKQGGFLLSGLRSISKRHFF